MKWIFRTATGLALLLAAIGGVAQTAANHAVSAAARTRYFQLTLNLKFGANGEQQATMQTITTEFAVRGTIPGTTKARMVSQTPAGNGVQTRYIEVGTKFDADDIHVEGNGVALHFVLSASRPVKMIKYKANDGTEIEEPIITDRTVELSVKLPLDKAKVVFDSSSKSLEVSKPLGGNAKDDPAAAMPKPDQPMAIEMTVSEVR
ncbi:hypothetical protein HDF16_001997 [Granulicella aggregans]|uniref:Uncharacterized protein n=1 Tax=Granulicella aggregans TaxID=474949 RepID=A0A7W7ZCL8_9BACT|nr:hypothetical protein [Granulicella aggregans]MBB5057312.1 hypothetical protein [Granulicella aggregans]